MEILEKIQKFKDQLIDNENDFWDLIEIIKEIPDVISVEVENSQDEKIWTLDNNDEFSYTRIKIVKKRKGEDYRKIWIEIYGIISMISEDYSGNCEPSFKASTPMNEWTDETTITYFSWHNHYGS